MIAASAEDIAVGSVVGDGRFAILSLLGEGAQARTYEAIDKSNGQVVALKCFDIRGATSWKDVELAERETAVLSSLEHPLLPRYLAHFEADGALFLVMEKVEGRTLQALGSVGQLKRQDVLAFLRDAAETLDYLHSRSPPIIHRDIKPRNVIRRPDGRFALVDFGSVAHVLRPEGGSTVVGTFGYMAPEQFQGRALPATDVYAVGVTALSMLTGREPDQLPHKGLAIDVPAALGQAVDPRLQRLLAALVNPDPDQRASTSMLKRELAMLEASDVFGQGSPAAGYNDETSRRRRKEKKRSKRHRHERAEAFAGTHRHRTAGARRGRHWPGPFGLPVLLAVVLLALWLARVATALTLRVALPTLLTLLSLVFGPALRDGARKCQEGGRQAERELRRASKKLQSFAAASGFSTREPSPPEPSAPFDRTGRRQRTAYGSAASGREHGEPRVRLDDPDETETFGEDLDELFDSRRARRTRP